MLVSLVVPTFNRAAFLAELLQSVVALDHRPVEVVIVDDGSTDDTPAQVEAFFAHEGCGPGITHIYERLPGRGGAPAARNRGVALARGEAVLFVDSDDAFASGGVGALVRRLEADPALRFAYGRVAITKSDLSPDARKGVIGGPFGSSPEEVAGHHWHTMGALYRRDCLDQVGGWNEALTGSQDWEFQARVKLAPVRGAFVDTLVGFWRQHDFGRIGATSFRPDYVASVMKACDSIIQRAREAGRSDCLLEQKLARRLLVHAVEWGANGHPAERNRCLAQARSYLSVPGSLGTLIALFQACPPFFDRVANRLLQIWQGRN
jgi:glycosyltransferase involved in cell wall biosynthesis